MEKNPSLWDINYIYKVIQQQLEESQGEIANDEQMNKLVEVEERRPAKIESLYRAISRLESDYSYLADESKRIGSYATATKNVVKRLKEYTLRIVNEFGPQQGETVSFDKKKNPPKLIVTNEQEIPSEYISEIVIREIDTKKLKEDLKAGKEVPGAHLEQGESLKIGRPKQ